MRDLAARFDGVAYTTLMTTMDRLHRKGVLLREKAGRRFSYQSRGARARGCSPDLAGDALAAILGPPRRRACARVVSFFVDAVQREDRDVLDALDALVRERRAAEDGRRP